MANITSTKTDSQIEFEKKLIQSGRTDFEIIEYNGATKPIVIKCTKCGKIFSPIRADSLYGKKCACTAQVLTQDCIKKIKTNYPFLNLISEYKNSHTPITLKCEKCSTEFIYNYPQNLFSNKVKQPCPTCRKQERDRTPYFTVEEFREILYEKLGDEFEWLDKEYINAKTPLKILHKECGLIWEPTWDSLSHNKGNCGKCQGKNLSQNEKILIFQKKLTAVCGGEYSLIEYNSYNEPAMIKHICGNIDNTPLYNYLERGHSCPICYSNRSHRENKIKEILLSNNINFIPQYKVYVEGNTYPVFFDFAIFDEDGNILKLIETDGQQHYEYNNFFYKDENDFKKSIRRDYLKTQFSIINQIPLLRIPPWKPTDEITLEFLLNSIEESFRFSKCKKYPKAILPTRATDGSAGYDLYCAEDIIIPSQKDAEQIKPIICHTGIRLFLPPFLTGVLTPRSSLPLKKGLLIANSPGIIDSDYWKAENEGEIGIELLNLGSNPIEIKQGERIAQIIINKYCPTTYDEKNDTIYIYQRTGGFGSTGN